MKPPAEDEDLVALREIALAYPEAWADYPWGELAVKVRKKAFVFMHVGEEALSVTVKLPHSHPAALLRPFAQSTGYGLGKAGWVTSRFGAEDVVPIELLRGWIDESFRAVAPKALVKRLPAS